MALQMSNEIKKKSMSSLGLLLVIVGLGFLLYSVNFAGENIVPAADTAWVMLYQAIMVILIVFVALAIIWLLLNAFGGLTAVAEAYRNRR